MTTTKVEQKHNLTLTIDEIIQLRECMREYVHVIETDQVIQCLAYSVDEMKELEEKLNDKIKSVTKIY